MMMNKEDAALELAVFKLVDHWIDKDTYDLWFKTQSYNGFEEIYHISSNNPDYHSIVSLVARKYNDTNRNMLSIG